MRPSEKAALIETVGTFIADRLKSALAPVLERLAAVESKQPAPGEKGDAGEPGKDGAPGLDGKDGRDGEKGEKGDPGLPGDPGKEGLQGKEGLPGRDGRDGLPGLQGEKGSDGKDGGHGRDGIDGKDGFGLDDFDVKSDDDGRTLVFSFHREGGEPVIRQIKTAIVLDRGVWREGAFQKGDSVTWGGSAWIAQRDTSDKPETSDAWRLSVKRGRDGKEGKQGPAGERGQSGEPGTPGRNY